MAMTVMTFLAWLGTLPDVAHATVRFVLILTPTVAPTATALPSKVTAPGNSVDPAIVVALIGFTGAIVAALIAGAFALYQLRRNGQLEQRRQQEQFRHEQEMLSLQKEVEERFRQKERDQQRQETEVQVAQVAMHHAQTLTDRVTAYRKAVRADPRIAQLQILDMNRPLALADIFIRLQLHQETRTAYGHDQDWQDAEQKRDPNRWLKVSRARQESRSSTALVPEEAIRQYKRCVIAGDPGAGKTTLLKYLTLQAINGQLPDLPDIPIHIELNAFASSGHRDLLEYASTVWEERYGFPKGEALAYMDSQLRDGNALLLLDALDETVTGTTQEQAEVSYVHASRAIMNVATLYHQVPIVVTARKAGYHQRARLAGFTELEVQDFHPEDIQQFIIRWFACHPDPNKRENAAELNAKLERNPRMQALAANPLLLSQIVIVYEDQMDLPERRAELYKLCVDILLTKWDASRNIRRLRAFKPEHKRQLLEEVAWHFHLQGQRYFPEAALLDVLANFLPAIGLQAEQNGQVLDEIAAENGLLKEQARGWQGFLHLTLQEYFAAQYAVDHQQLNILLQHRDDPWWEEVLLLYAGRIPDASLLLQQLLGLTSSDRVQDDLFHSNLILAGRCLAAYPTVRQTALRKEVTSRLLSTLKAAIYSLEAKRIAETLAEIGGGPVNSELVALLSNEQLDGWVRQRIAEALTLLIDDEEHVRALAAHLFTSDIAESIYSTLWTLSRQVGVKILLIDDAQGKRLEVVRSPSA